MKVFQSLENKLPLRADYITSCCPLEDSITIVEKEKGIHFWFETFQKIDIISLSFYCV